MTRRAADGAAGFTLLELLVAVTLLGFLMTLVFAGLRFGAKAWAGVEERSVAAADMAGVQDLLRRAIAASRPVFVDASPENSVIAFDGSSDSLALVAPLPATIGADVTGAERFFVARSGVAGDVRALFLSWRLDLPSADGGPSAPASRLMLLDHVRRIRFDYFGAPDGGYPAWLSTWSGRSWLPDLVRIRVERDDPRLPAWPDLLAEPKATTTASCRYNPVDTRCYRMR